MACKGEVCGAVTSGIMVIGMKHGMGKEADRAAWDRAIYVNVEKDGKN